MLRFLRKFVILSAILSVAAVNPWTQALSRELRTLERLQQMDERTEDDEESGSPTHSSAAKEALVKKDDARLKSARSRRAGARRRFTARHDATSVLSPLSYSHWHPSLQARVLLPRRAAFAGDDSGCAISLICAA